MAVFLFYTIQDADGDKSTIDIPFPNSFNMANAAAVVTAFAGVINPLLNGGLVSAGVRAEFDLSGTWGPAALLIADIQEQAQFLFRVTGGFPKLLNLPTFIETFFNSGGSQKTVDMTATEVVDFVNAMEDGLTVATVLYQPSDYRGTDILSTESAVQHWGRNRK